MNNKIGRNDPCWCGSGKKFKKCHLNKDNQEPLKRWELDKEIRKNFSNKTCLVPSSLSHECSGGIVRAHTVPKSSSLNKISSNGHVYGFIPSLEAISKSPQGKLHPQLIGINNASTFTGFCKYHDNSIFSEIELKTFTGSPKQCFLLAYRALTMGIYRKVAQIATFDYQDKLTSHIDSLKSDPFFNFMNSALKIGTSNALKDNDYYKKTFDDILLSGNFDDTRAYVVKFNNLPTIMCSSSFYPHKDFDGNSLQNIADCSVVPDLMNFTLYYGGTCGLAVFSWLPINDKVCIKFIDSLRHLSDVKISNALIRFMFSFSENIFIQPDWWENLKGNKKESLINRLYVAASLDPQYIDAYGDIRDDGYEYADWIVTDSTNIGFS